MHTFFIILLVGCVGLSPGACSKPDVETDVVDTDTDVVDTHDSDDTDFVPPWPQITSGSMHSCAIAADGAPGGC